MGKTFEGNEKMKVVCISDTHGHHRKVDVPDGNILIYAGDLMGPISNEEGQLLDFNKWLATLPHEHKVFVPGNHDIIFEKNGGLARSILSEAIYLEDNGAVIEGLRFWGSPVTPKFGVGWAFNRYRGIDISRHWGFIPNNTDVLVTHGPPHGILDKVYREGSQGCKDLARVVENLNLKLHVFGHIHEAYGIQQQQNTTFVNASVLNHRYELVNQPTLL